VDITLRVVGARNPGTRIRRHRFVDASTVAGERLVTERRA